MNLKWDDSGVRYKSKSAKNETIPVFCTRVFCEMCDIVRLKLVPMGAVMRHGRIKDQSDDSIIFWKKMCSSAGKETLFSPKIKLNFPWWYCCLLAGQTDLHEENICDRIPFKMERSMIMKFRFRWGDAKRHFQINEKKSNGYYPNDVILSCIY